MKLTFLLTRIIWLNPKHVASIGCSPFHTHAHSLVCVEQIQFFDSSDVLLGSINVNQSTPGFTASSSATLTGVKKIVLPTAAFYDNVNITPVPEPSLTVLGGVAALGLALRRRRA